MDPQIALVDPRIHYRPDRVVPATFGLCCFRAFPNLLCNTERQQRDSTRLIKGSSPQLGHSVLCAPADADVPADLVEDRERWQLVPFGADAALPLLAVQAGLGETCVFFLDGRIRQL